MNPASSRYATPERLRLLAEQIEEYGKSRAEDKQHFIDFRDDKYNVVAQISLGDFATICRASAEVVERWLVPEEKYW